MSLPSAAEIMSRYLFDSPTPPNDLKNDSLIRPETATGQTIHLDMSEYMSTGAGRFANATLSTLVSNFFDGTASQLSADGVKHEYSVAQMISLVGGSQSFSLSQYSYHGGANDDAERAFIFGTTGFKVSDEAVFVVDESGERTIENFAIYAFDDNFDFVSSDIPTQFINSLDRSLVDPSDIGRVFNIEYENKAGITTSTYDVNDYGDDLVRYSNEHGISHWPQLATDLYSLVTGFGPAGITSFLADPEWEGAPVRPVYYGTTENDHLGPSDVAETVLVDNMDNGIILLGGEGNDQIVGAATDDILYGGGDNDHLSGGDGYDQLYDGSGADVLEGGAGGDDFNLGEDGEADIVIAEGDDWISGGDANDRIVFRTDLLEVNPAHQDWSNPASGLSTPTTAIPLLGGFITFQDGDVVEAYYSSFPEGIAQTVYHLPEDPTDFGR